MADHTVITGVATALLSAPGGYIAHEVISVWRGRRTHRLAETKAPSEIEATISAGARDAVTALRESLAEYRSEAAENKAEMAELRIKCETTDRELEHERQLRRGLERKVALLEQRLAVATKRSEGT